MKKSLILTIMLVVLALMLPILAMTPTATSAAEKQYRIGVFAFIPYEQIQDMIAGFKKATTECGLVEGENLFYFVDFAQGQMSIMQLIAKRDLEKGVDLFLTLDTPSMITAASLTKTVPILAVAPTYPLEAGVVKSLERPGTNVTGGPPVWWSHPAFANRSIYVRNDREILCYSLAAGE